MAHEQKACEFSQKRCLPCEGLTEALTQEETLNYLKALPQWELTEENGIQKIQRAFLFKNKYSDQLLFINAAAWMAQQENHHPDFFISFNRCLVIYYTHALKGLSENDFICAAKLNKIYAPDTTV